MQYLGKFSKGNNDCCHSKNYLGPSQNKPESINSNDIDASIEKITCILDHALGFNQNNDDETKCNDLYTKAKIDDTLKDMGLIRIDSMSIERIKYNILLNKFNKTIKTNRGKYFYTDKECTCHDCYNINRKSFNQEFIDKKVKSSEKIQRKLARIQFCSIDTFLRKDFYKFKSSKYTDPEPKDEHGMNNNNSYMPISQIYENSLSTQLGEYISSCQNKYKNAVVNDMELNLDYCQINYYAPLDLFCRIKRNCVNASNQDWFNLFQDTIGFFKFNRFKIYLDGIATYFIDIIIARRNLVSSLKILMRLKVFVQSLVYLQFLKLEKNFKKNDNKKCYLNGIVMKNNIYSDVLVIACKIAQLPLKYVKNFLPIEALICINSNYVEVHIETLGKVEKDYIISDKFGLVECEPHVPDCIFQCTNEADCTDLRDMEEGIDRKNFIKNLYINTITTGNGYQECTWFRQKIMQWYKCLNDHLSITESQALDKNQVRTFNNYIKTEGTELRRLQSSPRKESDAHKNESNLIMEPTNII
ncbi:hypothetical protein A3Q56_04006 [Intoshia linei]|uniref:Uncharacterized protein n=1 Tax=Intoshia linei TaxID=1819745 RepID=A0A177B1U6_9BILA|nr:hypothetical protein A3Q56_04006 [Intoshia linei]